MERWREREKKREICETFRKKTNFYPPKKDVYVDSMFLRDFVLFMYSMSVYMYQYHNGHINKTTASNVSSFQIKDPHTPLHIKKSQRLYKVNKVIAYKNIHLHILFESVYPHKINLLNYKSPTGKPAMGSRGGGIVERSIIIIKSPTGKTASIYIYKWTDHCRTH